MATEIRRPQDCLTGRIRVTRAIFPRRRNCSYGNSYSNHRAANPRINTKPPPTSQHHHQPDRRRRASSEPAISKSSVSNDLRSSRSSSEDLRRSGVVTEVTILRRGESLDSKLRSRQVEEIRSPVTENGDMDAGMAFAVSPEPSSLPLPSFSKKKHVAIDDSATRDLRRLLRLD